jgi:hypothetical protein
MGDVIVNHMSSARRSSATTWRAARFGLCRPVPDLRHRVPAGRREADLLAHVPAAPGLAVHLRHAGQRRSAAAVDHLHAAAGRHRRVAPAGQGLPRRHPAELCRQRVSAWCGSTPWATRSRSPAQLLHDARDLRLHRRVRGARADAGHRGAGGGARLLPRQIEIARRVDWVYDFALPPLVLHALFFGTAEPLKRWIGMRPTNALTVLDTHDGIGIIDIGADPADRAAHPGLVPPARARPAGRAHPRQQRRCRAGRPPARRRQPRPVPGELHLLRRAGPRRSRLPAARAIQFFLPGVPQVYYVGLLAGENDMAALLPPLQPREISCGVGRDINRHHYDAAAIAEIAEAVLTSGSTRCRSLHPVVQQLLSS